MSLSNKYLLSILALTLVCNSNAAEQEFAGMRLSEIQHLNADNIGTIDPDRLAAIIAALEASSRDSDDEDTTFDEAQNIRRRHAAAVKIQALYRGHLARKRVSAMRQARSGHPMQAVARTRSPSPSLGAYGYDTSSHKEARAAKREMDYALKKNPHATDYADLDRDEVLFERAKKKWMDKNKKRGPGWEKNMLEDLRAQFPKQVKKALKSAPKTKASGRKEGRNHKGRRF